MKTAAIGSGMILSVLRRLQKGERLEGIAQEHGAGDYYSMPVEADFDDYFSKRRFFRLRDMFHNIWRRVKKALFRPYS